MRSNCKKRHYLLYLHAQRQHLLNAHAYVHHLLPLHAQEHHLLHLHTHLVYSPAVLVSLVPFFSRVTLTKLSQMH